MDKERIADRRVWLKGQISTLELGHRAFLLPRTDDINILYDLLALLEEAQIDAHAVKCPTCGGPYKDLIRLEPSPGLSKADERALDTLQDAAREGYPYVYQYDSDRELWWADILKAIAYLRSILEIHNNMAYVSVQKTATAKASGGEVWGELADAVRGWRAVLAGRGLWHEFDEECFKNILAHPKPTVTRANIVAILAEAGGNIGITTDRVERAIAQFRDLGITVEEEKNG